ncbi:TetR/AcrR family transcriptional regulator [Streptomyces sp. NPDC088747]|uniref:TetR/AcrR family transcriptional regulator n=1 Tax=Streptomyces sp. NPDC088747 TaxID=3365886 RepID=UPI00382CA697
MTSGRRYVSPYREKAAAQTRAAILRQAAELFAERGYGRVTVAEIANAAGVAHKTVFASVGSKADILDQIVDRAVADSGYRQSVTHMLTLDSAEEVLRVLAHGTRLGNEGQSTAQEAIRKALPVHENGQALWERATAAYRDALGTVAAHLAALGTGLGGHSVQEVADLLWLWFGPTGWRTLVAESGWSWDRAEESLYRTALATLDRPSAPRPDSGPPTP